MKAVLSIDVFTVYIFIEHNMLDSLKEECIWSKMLMGLAKYCGGEQEKMGLSGPGGGLGSLSASS